MTSGEIREKFINFYEKRGHTFILSASLIPENDPTLLFVNSGMSPLVPYFLGEKNPQGNRLVNIQKSFRTDDIEEVGDSRHTTFFEMLGNWSLGDYFKKEQLPWVYEFLIDELKLEPQKLYATVFSGNEEIGVPRDTDSANILVEIFSKYGIKANVVDCSENNELGEGRIFYYPDKKNWWSRSGTPKEMPVGEIGGPDSEIFYDLGADLKKHENSVFKDDSCHVNCDCGRFVEIGNSVFMEYKRTESGFEKLQQHNVDFGGGLERIAMAVNGLNSVFETDLFLPIISKIEELSGKKYNENHKSLEIIADHIKAAVFIIGDERGVAPSNKGQGYFARRLIRRAIRHGRQEGISSDSHWLNILAQKVIEIYKKNYPELEKNSLFIFSELEKEQSVFQKTLDRGLKEFEKLKDEKVIGGKEAAVLYQSYGFPIEMIEELAEEKGQKVNREDFQKEIKKHKEMSRTASAGSFKGGLADSTEETTKLHTATHLLLAALKLVLGKEISQRGSNINSERLRFDFSFSRKPTEDEIKKVEDIMNSKIKEGLDVFKEEMNLEDALKSGSSGTFGEKYPEKVTVYTIGKSKDDFLSKEICHGPHIDNISKLGTFKIIKEEASSAGVRRIKAKLDF